MRHIYREECDSTDEICKLFQEVFDNQAQIDGKVTQLATANDTYNAEVDKYNEPPKKKPKKKSKKGKGNVLMKTLIGLVLFVLIVCGVCFAQEQWPITYTTVSTPDQLVQLLRNRFANQTSETYTFTPRSTTPGAAERAEGMVYFDNDTNNLQLWDGSTWAPIDVAGGVSLDSAYDFGSSGGGRTITASDGAVLIQNTEADSVPLLQLTYSTGAQTGQGMLVQMAGGSGNAIAIMNQGSGYDVNGTSATWTVDKEGNAVFVDLTTSDDVLFAGTNYDVSFDASNEGLLFEDNCILGLGGDHDGAADMTFTGDGSHVYVEVASEDGADLIFGATNALDIIIYNDAADSTVTFDQSGELLTLNGWDIQLQSDDLLTFGDSHEFTVDYDDTTTDNLIIVALNANDKVQIGDGSTGTDLRIMAATSGDFFTFDVSEDELVFEDCNVVFNEASYIEFKASDNAADWTIALTTDEQLIFLPTEITDDQAINFGTADNTSDVNFFGATASTVLFDASGNEVIFDAYDLRMNDNDILGFGDANDFTVTSSSATQLDIGSLLTDETAAIDFGAFASGIDVNLFAAGAANFVRWDSSTADLIVEDCNIHIMDAIASSGVSTLIFGDGDDIQIQFDGTNGDLDMTGDGLEFAIGATAAGMDVIWWEGVSGDFVIFDESRGDIMFDDVNLVMMDDTFLSLGDVNDFQISCTSATQLDITTPLIATSVIAIDFGVAEAGIDVNLFGEAAGSQMVWDASRAELFFETADVNISDTATLSFGDGVDFIFNSDTDGRFDVQTTATDESPQFCFGYDTVGFDVNFAAALGDDYVRFDASRGDMLFEDVNIVLMDNTYVAFGDVNDFQIRSTSATQLDITTPLIDTSVIAIDFGVAEAGIDVNLFGEAAGARMVWDASLSELFFETADVNISDSATLSFGDGVDFIINCDADARLDIQTTVTDESGQVCFGKDGEGIDVNFAGYEAVTWARFDASAEDFIFEDINVMLMDDTKLVFGDSDDFTVAATSATQLDIVSLIDTSVCAIDFGVDQAGIDVNLFGESAGAKVVWDASLDELFFESVDVNISDSATLSFGDGIDFIINSDTAARLDVQTTATDESPMVCFGYDEAGVDVNFAAGLADDWARFDASRGDFLFEDVNIVLMDDTFLSFGDVNDFQIRSTSATQLDITMALIDDETGAIDFGADQVGIDVNMFGATGNAVMRWDASADELCFETADVNISDSADLIFGDGDDFAIDCDVAARLDILPAAADETPIICFGYEQAGIDVNFTGYEADTWARFDASAEDFIFEDVNVMLMDNTELIFGDSDDVICDFNSTEAALQVNGFMYGAKRQIEHITASHTLTAQESGKVFYVSKALAGVASDEVLTLPDAEVGLEYIIIDANETADADVTIQTAAGDKINDGAAAAKYVHDTDADNYATCYIIAIDDVDWVVISETGTWQNE